MNIKQNRDAPFVLFQIQDATFAISATYVREVTKIPRVIPIPTAPPQIRGTINLRGRLLRLIDLRTRLGLRPLKAELEALVQLLNEREQDHRNWLTELEGCVRQRRSFKLARDPHKCKFGLWYDRFRNDDWLLRMILPAMDAPHKAIHAAADEALNRAENGDFSGAMQLIEARRENELARLILLFSESRRRLLEEEHEMAIVLTRRNECIVYAADRVQSVERIPEDRIQAMPAALSTYGSDFHCRIAQRSQGSQSLLILDEDFLFAFPAKN